MCPPTISNQSPHDFQLAFKHVRHLSAIVDLTSRCAGAAHEAQSTLSQGVNEQEIGMTVMGTIAATPDYAAIKTKQNAAWASGDYARIGTTLQIVGENLAEAMDLSPDRQGARRGSR